MNNMNTRELVSALADGQLVGQDLADALSVLENDPQAIEAWHAYHLIGDALRSPDLASRRSGSMFVERISQRLAAEATSRSEIGMAANTVGPVAGTADAKPANDPVFRWKVAAGLASLAAAVSVSWTLLAASVQDPAAAQLASTTVPAANGVVMIRNPQLDELLAAHQQFGGSGALPMPAAFVRQVTFDVPAR